MHAVSTEGLSNAVSTMCSCTAVYRETVPIEVMEDGVVVWRGDVSVFDLEGHLTANRAYGWSHVSSTGTLRLVTQLHEGPIDSPMAAARRQIAEDRRPPHA